jgi:hypothetical protein
MPPPATFAHFLGEISEPVIQLIRVPTLCHFYRSKQRRCPDYEC